MSNKLKIAVASGKGGTGKTTVSANLFSVLREKYRQNASLADCDVEEPNDHIFFDTELLNSEDVNTLIPEINDKCVYCGICADICAFNAIIFVKSISHIQVMPDLCKSCGACKWACPYDAIDEYPKKLGTVNRYKVGEQILTEGKLEIGTPFAIPVIKQLKKSVPDSDIVLYDSPPGTSCPVMETIHDADYVIIVAEPTPFGMSDLKVMTETLKQMHLSAGVVINRSEGKDQQLREYLHEQKLPVLMEIPYERELAEQYSRG